MYLRPVQYLQKHNFYPKFAGTAPNKSQRAGRYIIKDYEQLDAHIPNAIRIDFPVKQLIDSFAILPLDFIPSTKYSYSNSNYFLL